MKSSVLFLLLCFLLIGLTNCGGGNHQQTYNPPPPPPVSITLSVSSATVQTTGYNDPGANQFQFTATVQNATDKSVTWDVNAQLADNDTAYGRISSNGVYSAPMLIPSQPVVVRATANADKTKSATATITLQWAAQLYNLQVASSVETSSRSPIQLFFDTYGPKDVTWTVNGAAMGSPTGGAIALDYTGTSGNYIAPATIPASTVHLTATLKSNTKSISKDIAITGKTDPNSPNLVITPASATLQPGTTQSFSVADASSGDPVLGAYWTTGSGVFGGSYTHVLTDGILRADGTYTAPFDPPDNRTVVVTASYNGSTTRSGYAIVTLADPAVDPNSRFNGPYAFSLHDSSYLTTVFGTLTADGHGHLSGTADFVTNQGKLGDQPIAGSYTAHADGRVEVTITYTPSPGQTFTQSLSLMFVSDTRAYASTSGSLGMAVGTVQKQDASAFNNASLQGDYGFLVRGASYNLVNQVQIAGPYSWGGVLTLNADGTIAGMGTWDNGAAYDEALTGSYTFNSSTGRGVLTIPTSGPTYHFNFAVISANKVLLATSDDLSLGASGLVVDGFAERRAITPPLNPASLTGPFVFYLSGQQFVEAGHFSADGAGGINHGLLDMRYSSGSADPAHLEWTIFDGDYSMDANDPYGRGRLHLNVQPQHTTANLQQFARFYMVAPDKLILLMDSMTSAIAGEAFQETLSTGVPDDGRYAVHFVGPDMTHYATGWTMPLVLATGTPWIGWLNYPGSSQQAWELDCSGAQSSDVYTFNVSMFTGEAFPYMRAYAISPSKWLLIGLDMGYSGPNEFAWMEKIEAQSPQY